MRIYPLENSYLTLHMEDRNPSQYKNIRLGHIYPPDFSKPKTNFLTLKEVDESIEPLSTVLLLAFGSILIQNSQQILFVPYIYNGNLYEYSNRSTGWQRTQVHEGLNQQTPYSLIEEDAKRKPDGSLSAVHLNEDKHYIAHNKTRGLLKYNGYIFHFTFSDINDKRVFGVELYDESMRPVGYAPIESIPITNKENNYLNWSVEDVDENGNFYFLQDADRGKKIRLMQIDPQDLKNISE